MPFVKTLVAIGFFCAVLVLAACGSGDATGTTHTDKQLASTAPGEHKLLPRIQVPKGPPPKKLAIKDLKVGYGKEVTSTDAVVVAYEGVAYKTGKRFDIRTRSEPFFFQTGIEGVMPGFDRTVVGMKVGGLREATIPPNLTLDELGKPETLIYVIELLSDESAARYHHRLKHSETLLLTQFD
jgi:peptidylprolyl isomerase